MELTNVSSIFRSIIIFACIGLIQLQHINHKEKSTQNDEFDLLIFTQQWPATVCMEWKDRNHSHSCAWPSSPDAWSIHGIWPTKLGTKGPSFCNRTWLFDPEQIRPIEPVLMRNWVNIEVGTPLYDFWAHEWNKHGTCAAVLPPLNSEFKYFSTGLDLLQKYTMRDVLREGKILPSDDQTYAIADIYNAIKVRLGVNPMIECREEKRKNFLAELRICFDKELKLKDCDGVGYTPKSVPGSEAKIITNCDPLKQITYMEHVPGEKHDSSSHYVNWYKLILWLQWLTF